MYVGRMSMSGRMGLVRILVSEPTLRCTSLLFGCVITIISYLVYQKLSSGIHVTSRWSLGTSRANYPQLL
jgi:hypothetical protein